MKLQNYTFYFLLIVGLVALLIVSILSQLSLHEVRADKDKWDHERTGLETSLSDTVKQLEDLKVASTGREKEMLQTIKQQTDERLGLNEELKKATDDIEALTAKSAGLEKSITELTKERDGFISEKKDDAIEIIKLQKEIETRTVNQKELLTGLDTLKTLIEGLTAKLGESEKTLMASFEELKALKTNNEALAVQIEEFKTASATSETALQTSITELAAKKDEADKALQAALADLAIKKEEADKALLASLEEMKTSDTTQATVLEEIKIASAASEKSLQATLADLATKKAEADKVLLGSLEEIKTLKTNNDTLAVEITKLTKELRETTQKLTSLELMSEKYRLERDRLKLEALGRADNRTPVTTSPPANPGIPATTTPKVAPVTPAPKTGESSAPPKSAVPIETVVAAVNDKEGVVVLGAGQTKGVTAGMLFTIHDTSGAKVATVKTTQLYDQYTGCMVVDKKAGIEIKEGFRATTE